VKGRLSFKHHRFAPDNSLLCPLNASLSALWGKQPDMEAHIIILSRHSELNYGPPLRAHSLVDCVVSSLRHYATNWKVAGSIFDEVIGLISLSAAL
jgi:hypothetical protein